jgi:hypothetical protein
MFPRNGNRDWGGEFGRYFGDLLKEATFPGQGATRSVTPQTRDRLTPEYSMTLFW